MERMWDLGCYFLKCTMQYGGVKLWEGGHGNQVGDGVVLDGVEGGGMRWDGGGV